MPTSQMSEMRISLLRVDKAKDKQQAGCSHVDRTPKTTLPTRRSMAQLLRGVVHATELT